MKTYKVGIVPGTITEVVVDNESTTVKELFELAGLMLDTNHTVRKNGEPVSREVAVGDAPTGTSFYATRMIKGN